MRAISIVFRREMAAVFPQSRLEPIPVDDPLLGTTYGGADLRTVTRRDPDGVTIGPSVASITVVVWIAIAVASSWNPPLNAG